MRLAGRRAVEEVEPLEELGVDLEQLADLIDGGPESAGGRLDLTTGEVLPEFAFEDTFEEEDVRTTLRTDGYTSGPPGRGGPTTTWSTSSRRATDQRLREQLDLALDGRGAFRRFKDVLFDWPDDRDSSCQYWRARTQCLPPPR